MNETMLSQTAQDLIYLIHCALHGQKAEVERVERFDMEKLFTLAKFHSLNAMASFPLEGVASEEAMAPWREGREKALRKNLLLDLECQHLCGVMESWGIWHMRLKGSVMKELYPRMEMRQMSDQDILFDTTYRTQMRHYMLDRGYNLHGPKDTHHDTYYKPPVYNIELHHALFAKNCNLQMVGYYSSVKDRLIQDGPESYGYHFTDEDFYVYMTAHAYNHYLGHGVGLRSYVDVYLYERQKGATMDWAYIRQECAKLDMEAYEQQNRVLAHKLFDGDRLGELTEEEQNVLRYCFESGAYGSKAGRIRYELKRLQADGEKAGFGAKSRYLMKRLFPSLEQMKQKSYMVRKHPWTLPFAWIVRLCRGIFKWGGYACAELRYVLDVEEL